MLRGDPRDYTDRFPEAEDALVVFEVADASLHHDRTTRLSLYARAGIAQYVIVDLRHDCIERYALPDGASGSYAELMVLRRGELLWIGAGGPLEVLVDNTLLP